ncbi:DNA-directed RNA polymerase subunit delta [Candidatus Xianfuyuplasma coldseepsis]|uniref:RNAP delta factor n=1 Tax=Candidatus Xianfuyuplasma coldseepsis TaxID=2782163 RepID=A0A7L7KRW0_9MOLU|nr:DNA-directed RNA polymerase subunit delta [Xianfuyuplasma coldseepsis]QMS84992.1 DNA-directed RNA polymerase subunit delta [Xianfuyuplasma coldseepsis]
MTKELSLMDAATMIMANEKKAFDVYDLFDRVAALLELSEDQQANLISKFYADLTTSAKFVYVGNNEWNLKSNEKIELWEKDGSFYKEYTVVELPEEYKVDPFAQTKKPKPKPAPAPKEEPEVVVEEVVIDVVEVPEEVVVQEETKPAIEPAVDPQIAIDSNEAEDDYEEEIFEDYDDFDEEKYNEYMDTYEDQYDD